MTLYDSDYSPHPQRDGIVESAPKMVQLPVFRIGQFPYFNLNLSPSSSRYFHFFFTSTLLNKIFSGQTNLHIFRKPDFMWFFIHFFQRYEKSLGSVKDFRISFHCTRWCDVQDHILWKQTDLNTHLWKKTCWKKNYPKLENTNIYFFCIYLPWKPKNINTSLQLNEVPG